MASQPLQAGVEDMLCDFDNTDSNDIPLLQLHLGFARGACLLAANSLFSCVNAHGSDKG